MTQPAADPRTFFSDPSRYFRHDYFIDIRCALVRRLAGSVRGASILDLGCGDGRVSLQFCGEAADLTLVDFSEAMLERARARVPQSCARSIQFAQSDITSFDPRRTYDVVLCLGVVPHLPDARDAIRIVASMMAPHGIAIVQITDGGTTLGRLALAMERWRSASSGRPSWIKPTSVDQIDEWARDEGLVMDAVERHGLIVPGAGRLPNAALLRWERFVVARPWLARAGADAIVRLRRLTA